MEQSRESEKFIRDLLSTLKLDNCQYVIVSESGASIYSASPLAKKEFPDFDVNLRSAVSIARRLAHEVQKTHTDVVLDPMPADERRMIHNALAGMPNIKTESEGFGNKRQIHIKFVD